MARQRLTANVCVVLGAPVSMQGIKKLVIGGNEFGDGIKSALEITLIKNKVLEKIDLANNALSDVAAKHIATGEASLPAFLCQRLAQHIRYLSTLFACPCDRHFRSLACAVCNPAVPRHCVGLCATCHANAPSQTYRTTPMPRPNHGCMHAGLVKNNVLKVRVASRSISPRWRSIRFRLAHRTYAHVGPQYVWWA